MNAELDDPRSAQSGRCCSIPTATCSMAASPWGQDPSPATAFIFMISTAAKTRVAGTAATCVSGDGCLSPDPQEPLARRIRHGRGKAAGRLQRRRLLLKLRALDLDIVWTPHARLVHRESVSRGRDDTEEKRQRFAGEERVMFERWQAVIGNDPIYNPNCSLSAADFSLEACRAICLPQRQTTGSRIP